MINIFFVICRVELWRHGLFNFIVRYYNKIFKFI